MSTTKTNFSDLLKAIGEAGDDAENLSKQTGTDDQTIQAAATGSDDNKDPEAGKTDPDLTKSLTVTGADGKQEQVIDATDMIKSLQEMVGEHDEVLAKALGDIGGVLQVQNDVLKKQDTLLKSMGARLDELAGQGRGRKAVISAHDKPAIGGDLQKSQDAGEGAMSVGDFLLKSNAAYDAGKITGAELRSIDVAARHSMPIDQGLIAKVKNASA